MCPQGSGICGGPCTQAGGAASAWHAVTSGLPWPPWPPWPNPGPDKHPQPPSPTRVRKEPRAQTRRLEGTCSDTWFSGLPWKHTNAQATVGLGCLKPSHEGLGRTVMHRASF